MTNFKTDRTMKTIKIFSAALFVLVAAACNTDYLSENMSNLEPMTIAGTKTKTILNQADGSVSWTARDQIAIYDNFGGKNIFANTSENIASFTGNVTAGTTQFWGVYPTNLISGFNSGTVTMTLPSDQTPVAGTFAEELNISVTSGMKTPGTEQVEGISFHNACGLISFTVPENIAAQKVTFISDNSFLCGTLSVDCTTSEAVLSSNQSNSVSMTGDFEEGSTFYFVVAPGQIEGFSINVETKNGSYYSKSASNGSINVTAGSLTRLGQISFKAGAVTASAQHIYESEVLTGSSLTVNHGIPQNMWNDVTNLTVNVVKGGKTYRNYSASGIESASVVPIGNTYLPQGSYDVNVAYTMNGVATNIAGSVTVPQPNKLTITSVEATTSYSLAKKGGSYVDQANSHEPEKITSPKCTFEGVSTAVLNELKPTCSFSVSGKTNQGTVSGTSGSCGEFSGLSWGSHTLTATVTFDGVSSSATTTCHITGLPYRKDFLSSSTTVGSGAQDCQTSGKVEYWGSHGYQILKWYMGGVTAGTFFSPQFKLPETRKISYESSACYFTTGVGKASVKIYHGITTYSNKSTTNSLDISRVMSNSNPSSSMFTSFSGSGNLSSSQRISIGSDEQKDNNVAENWVTIGKLNILYAN